MEARRADIRERLAERIKSAAAWRTAQSTEHPEDEANRRSAEALTGLAGHVMTLLPGDRRLEVIAALNFAEHPFPGGDEVDQLIARYGANRHLQSHPDTFLRDLVGIADRHTQISRRAGRADVNQRE
jgi:hypothetical protein